MNAKNVLEHRADELMELMRTLGKMLEAAQRGEPMASLSAEQTKALLLTVGDALMANHRAIRAQPCASALAT